MLHAEPRGLHAKRAKKGHEKMKKNYLMLSSYRHLFDHVTSFARYTSFPCSRRSSPRLLLEDFPELQTLVGRYGAS